MLRTVPYVIALLVAVSAPADVHAGACARPALPTRALTAPDAELAKGGGVVVAMENAAKAPAMTFGKTAATKTVIGAGLVVYTPPAGTGALVLQLEGKDLVTVKRGGDAKVLDAPKVANVRHGSWTGRRGTSVSVTVEITGDLPAGVVAVALFDDKGKIRSWGTTANQPPIEATTKTHVVSVYASGSCVVQPEGFAPSVTTDKVQVAYIDASGRVSAKTPATVTLMPDNPNQIR
jgi:hypothetical protein